MKIFLLIISILFIFTNNGLATNYSQDASIRMCLPLEEGSGTTSQDASSNNNDADTSGTSWYNTTTPGAWSTWALDMDGANYGAVSDANSLSFGNDTTDTACSAVMFVNLDDATSAGFISKGQYNLGSGEYGLYTYSDDKIYLDFFDSGATPVLGRGYNTVVTGNEGDWIQYGFSYDGSSTEGGIAIYVDGSEVDDISDSSGTYVAMNNYSDNLKFGAFITSNSYILNGKQDDIGLFGRVLSSVEFGDIKTNGLLGSAPPVARRIMFIN